MIKSYTITLVIGMVALATIILSYTPASLSTIAVGLAIAGLYTLIMYIVINRDVSDIINKREQENENY